MGSMIHKAIALRLDGTEAAAVEFATAEEAMSFVTGAMLAICHELRAVGGFRVDATIEDATGEEAVETIHEVNRASLEEMLQRICDLEGVNRKERKAFMRDEAKRAFKAEDDRLRDGAQRYQINVFDCDVNMVRGGVNAHEDDAPDTKEKLRAALKLTVGFDESDEMAGALRLTIEAANSGLFGPVCTVRAFDLSNSKNAPFEKVITFDSAAVAERDEQVRNRVVTAARPRSSEVQP